MERSSELSGSRRLEGVGLGAAKRISKNHTSKYSCRRVRGTCMGRDNAKLSGSVAEAVNLSPPLGKVFSR